MLRFRTRLSPGIAFTLLAIVIVGSVACSGSSTDNGFVPPAPPIGPIVYCPPDTANSQPLAALGGYQDSLLNGEALPHLVRGSGTPAYGNELDDAFLILRADSTYDTHGDGATNGVGDTTMVRDHGVYSQCGSTLHFYSQTHRSIRFSAQLEGGAISMSLPAELMDRFEDEGHHGPYQLLLTKIP